MTAQESTPRYKVQLNEDQLNERARHLAALEVKLLRAQRKRAELVSAHKEKMKAVNGAIEAAQAKVANLAMVIETREEEHDAQLPMFSSMLDALLNGGLESARLDELNLDDGGE